MTESFQMPPQELTQQLKSKVILITGASGSIGSVISKALAGYGANIILLGRNVKKLETLYDDICQIKHAPEPAIYPLDLQGATAENYKEMAKTIEQQMGKLNGVIHCAAILGEMTSIQECDPAVWKKVFNINLHGPFLLTQACLPLLLKENNSRIIFHINQSSGAYWGAYSASNAGLKSLINSLNEEYESKSISISAIEPVNLTTQMRARIYPGDNLMNHSSIESAVHHYVHLISEHCSETSGQIITV